MANNMTAKPKLIPIIAMFRMAFVPPFLLESLLDLMIFRAMKKSSLKKALFAVFSDQRSSGKSIIFFLLMAGLSLGLSAQTDIAFNKDIIVGAERLSKYLPRLEGKRIAIVGNQTSTLGEVHLVDTLLALDIEIIKGFTPEHGFRGLADAGEHVSSTKDEQTGIKLVSLYGSRKKPRYTDLEDVELLIFDIQDVGVRFYTYISTLHYVMEACAEYDVPLLVLDRPNPNGFYVDGPVLEEGFSSFVGMHRVPLVHGMTVGEYAKMLNGEGWLNEGVQCDLTVIPCKKYSHKDYYELPVRPSPNLPNMSSIYLYPSLGLFEGAIVSVGRGTDKPFQMFGHPDISNGGIEFQPQSILGARAPKLEGQLCKGYDLQRFGYDSMPKVQALYLHWLKAAYDELDRDDFFLKNDFINLLSGTERIKNMIVFGATVEEMERTWKDEVIAFKKIRKKYLLYEDFE